MLKTRDHGAIGEALYIIAAAAFGASIALIGQMYHMSGDESDAVVTWCVGTGIAALALRSNPLTVAAVALASTWLALRGMGYWTDQLVPASVRRDGGAAVAGVLLDRQRGRRAT